MSNLPEHNVSGKTAIDRTLFDSADWIAGKTEADIEAAKRLVSRLWSEKKTQALMQLLDGRCDAVFVSQPTSSGFNIIPAVFARTLSERIGAEYLPGEELYVVLHPKEIKNIPRFQRVFHPRKYISVDRAEVDRKLSGKAVIIADDILTTGGSVKHFIGALAGDGIGVLSVAALTGDPRLLVDNKTRVALKRALHDKQINISGDFLADNLTRTEARNLTLLINNLRTENAKAKLTRKIQGVLDKGITQDLGRDPDPEGDQGTRRQDSGFAPSNQGISPRDTVKNRQTPYLSLAENKNALPRDFPSLKALWDSNIEKLSVPIIERAAKTEKKLKEMLALQEKREKQHNKNKPIAPSGAFVGMRKTRYIRRIVAWKEIKKNINRRMDQLNRRLEMVREYNRNPVSYFYPSKAQQKAGKLLSMQQPDLAHEFSRVRENQLKQRSKLVTEEIETKKRSRGKNRGRHQ
jgi:hypothetical protein